MIADRRAGMPWKDIAAKYGLSGALVARNRARHYLRKIGEWPLSIGESRP